jgi:hypothetical protein
VSRERNISNAMVKCNMCRHREFRKERGDPDFPGLLRHKSFSQ